MCFESWEEADIYSGKTSSCCRLIDWRSGEQFLKQSVCITSPFLANLEEAFQEQTNTLTLHLSHMHQAYCPLPRCTLTNNETDWCALGSCLLAGHVPQWQGSRSYKGCHTSQQAGWHTWVQGICMVCLSVTWRHWSRPQFIHESEGLLGWCCRFWQEWWS